MASTLNQETLAHLRAQHPAPERFEDFISTCLKSPRQAIRITNASSTIIEQWARDYSWQLTQVPWSKEGVWIEREDDRSLGNHIGHLCGHFYIQEATSMLPVAALQDNHTPQMILDMAAAPGSKTTQLALNLAEPSLIVANDMSSSRTKMLNANLIRMGLNNYALLNQDATRLSSGFHGQFDSILLDAPCGGEGTIRKDPKAWHNWSLSSLNELSRTQESLITAAWSLLRPGGRLVYSTCSLSREENQHVVKYLLDNNSDADLLNLSSLFSGAEQMNDEGMLHVWPEVMDTEGFFVACIEKSGVVNTQWTNTRPEVPGIGSRLFDKVSGYYLDHFGIELSDNLARYKVTEQGNKLQLWLLPDLTIEGGRLQRHGIHLCTIIQGRKGININTHHDFVRCFGNEALHNSIELSPAECVAYFQGKNLSTSTREASGETILMFEDRSIGLAKLLKGGQLKNQLPRELVHDKAWF